MNTMKNYLLALISFAAILLFSNNSFAQSPTTPALGFNAFLQQNATLITNESEGPIAIGGNLTVGGNYQVNIHSVGTFSVSNAPIGLFVGGQVILSSGSLQVNSGRYVKIGNCAASNIKTWYVDNNNAASNIYITGSGASYASTPNININSNNTTWGTAVSASNNPVCDANTATEINFATAFSTMQASATNMAACNTSGNILSNPNQNIFGSTISSVLTGGQIKITLASGTNVLNVSGADLNSVTNGITFTNSPDANHVLVINVNAAGSYTWNVWNQGGVSATNAPFILYNFYNTTSLNIAGNNTIEGTVFAPNAAITKTVNQSNIEGQVIGQSFVQSGGELHYYPFTPTIAGCVVTPSAPTVSVTPPSCSNTNGIVTITSSTSGLTFSSDGKNYSNTTSFTIAPGQPYSITAQNASGTVSAATTGTMPSQTQINVLGPGIAGTAPGIPNPYPYPATNTFTSIQGRDNAYNVFIGGNLTCNSGSAEVEGRIFVNGNLSIAKNSGTSFNLGFVGAGSYVVPDNGTDFVLVGGNISATSGVNALFGGYVGSTNVSGNIRYLGTKSGSFSAGDIGQTGQLISSPSYSLSCYTPVLISLKNQSTCLGALSTSSNVTSSYSYGTYTFTSTNAATGLYVINIGTDIEPGYGATFSFNNFPDNATIVINMTESGTCTIDAANFTFTMANGGNSNKLAQNILWNFPNASTVNLKGGAQFRGSILSNAANNYLDVSTNGRLVAIGNVFQGTNSSGIEFHNYPFNGNITTCTVTCSPTTATLNVSACNSYTWHGTTYTTSGTLTFDSLNKGGCDSLTTLNLTIKQPSSSTTNASICAGTNYTFNGSNYSNAGSYLVHLTNAVGCDSAATLVLTVKQPSTSTTNASICSGTSYTFNGTSYSTAGSYTAHLINSVGCDSAATLILTVNQLSSSTTNATICDGSAYIFNGTNYTNAGSYMVHLTNAVGCDSAATLILSVNPLPAMTSIFGSTDNLCPGLTTVLTDNTVGGVWASSDTSIATIDLNGNVTAIADGNTVFTYTVSGICSTYASYPFAVKCDTSSAVSSGSVGGLESKSLGAAIGTRNFNIYKNSQNGAVVYTEAQKIVAPKKGSIGTFGINSSTSLASLMPYSANKAYTAYDQSAAVTDLESITNAVDVRAIDFTLNNSPKAVAFATKTIGGIYSHTKTICDRLKGAQLLDIQNVTIANNTFIQYKIKQANGDMEYAISFSAGTKAGRNTCSIQSNWLMTDYVSEDTMYNYQLWAANPTDVATMAKEVLGKLQAIMPLVSMNSNDLPSAYVSAATRVGTSMNLTINNRTANTTGYFQLQQKATENSTSDMTQVVPFTINTYGTTTVTIPVSDNYDANISMVFNNSTTDALYMADGIWGTSGDNNTTVSKMNVANNLSKQYAANEYPLLRDVNVSVTTPSYVSIYKYLKGGAAAVDLSTYKSFHFTASTNASGMNLKVTITKLSLGNWNSQYSYTISNFQNGQTYSIALSDLKSTDGTLPAIIDASDITSVVYNVENTSGQTLSFNAGISNAAFSTEDIALERALEVKTVNVTPNPSNGNFKVSFASPSTTQLRLAITDITGRILNSQMVNAVTGTNEVSVNLGQAINGSIYFVSLQSADSKYTTQKMMIKK